MSSVVKVSTGYRVQLYVKGIRASKVLPTKREALEWADSESRRLRNEIKGTNKTLHQALKRYGEEVSPTKRGELYELKRLEAMRQQLPDCKLSNLTTDMLGKWRDQRLKVVQPGSVLRDITLLGSVLETCRREWKWVAANPMRDMRKPPAPRHRERLIAGLETRQMLRVMGYSREVRTVSNAVAHAFLFALSTGMRAGEICGLEWSRVHADHVVLQMTKNGTKREVPLSPVARKILSRMRGFELISVFSVSTQTLDALFRKYRKRAGLDGFTFHDSRHTAATRLSSRLDVLTLCKVMGWTKTDQALTYYNPKASDIAKKLQ